MSALLASAPASILSEETQMQQPLANHPLSNEWILWAHIPSSKDWTMKGYVKISSINTLEEVLSITETLPEDLLTNCMLFLMRSYISPRWEDEKNVHGGCFSYKVSNNNVKHAWCNLTYALVGNTISPNRDFMSCVNGITISPKKKFCIIKIWMNSCVYQNPAQVTSQIRTITPKGCIFKEHDK